MNYDCCYLFMVNLISGYLETHYFNSNYFPYPPNSFYVNSHFFGLFHLLTDLLKYHCFYQIKKTKLDQFDQCSLIIEVVLIIQLEVSFTVN